MTIILQNPAFPAAVQAMESTPIERAYLVIVATALSSAIIYLYIQGEKKAKLYAEKLEKIVSDGHALTEKLNNTIDRFNRDSEDRHRQVKQMFERNL